MLELLICALFTIFPDYLFRRYGQGKRFGREITLFSVWFELRWGIVTCVMLTVALITVIFYYHPSTTSATVFFRTVPIVPEVNGRVAEVHVGVSQAVAKGDLLFSLDNKTQASAVEAARRKIAEADAALVVAKADILADEGKIQEAKSSLQQALDELRTKTELQRRNDAVVAAREIERLENLVAGREAALLSVTAARDAEQTGSRRCFPPSVPAPRPRLHRPRPNCRRRWCGRGLPGGWSNSRCGSAISSTRSCAPQESSSRKRRDGGGSWPGSTRSRRR